MSKMLDAWSDIATNKSGRENLTMSRSTLRLLVEEADSTADELAALKARRCDGWAYDLDGECICCGEWSYHAPGCKLDAAIRVWRKVQACVSGSEISTIDESGVLIRAGNGLNLDGLVLVGANVWYSTASGLLAWLKDGEA